MSSDQWKLYKLHHRFFFLLFELNLQERNKSGIENLPLEETLIVSLGWAGREKRVEKLETGVAELTAKLTAEVVDELAEEVAMGLVNKYKAFSKLKMDRLANNDTKFNTEHPVPSAPPKNMFSDESDGN